MFVPLAQECHKQANSAYSVVCPSQRPAWRLTERRGRAALESKWELKNVQTRTADSPRGSSPLAPSTVSPKYLPPPLGVRPPYPLSRPCWSCVSLSKHMREQTHQSSCFCVERIRGVEELEAGLRVVWDLLSVLEPLVLRLGEALFLHAAQLGWLPKRHWFWDAALWHHWLYCSDTQYLIRVVLGSRRYTSDQSDTETGLFTLDATGFATDLDTL